MDADDIDDIVETAHALADVAREVTLAHFRRDGLSADNKYEVGFDPVTEADRACERAMRALLARRRPRDGILGEEYGTQEGESGLTWVLDPIDGTRAFLSGAPTWGVLIALADAGGPIYGLIDQPYIGESDSRAGRGARGCRGRAAPRRWPPGPGARSARRSSTPPSPRSAARRSARRSRRCPARCG